MHTEALLKWAFSPFFLVTNRLAAVILLLQNKRIDPNKTLHTAVACYSLDLKITCSTGRGVLQAMRRNRQEATSKSCFPSLLRNGLTSLLFLGAIGMILRMRHRLSPDDETKRSGHFPFLLCLVERRYQLTLLEVV
jgi:hypothetical protein